MKYQENTQISLGTKQAISEYSKTCVKRLLSKRPKVGFQDQVSLNAGHKYCRMLQGEHSAIRSTFIKLPFVIKIFALSIFERPFYTGFTVQVFRDSWFLLADSEDSEVQSDLFLR